MIDLNNVAMACQRSAFWVTPFKTGNLARSVTDVGTFYAGNWGQVVGFYLIGDTAPYGKILNEYPVINYKLTNPTTGRSYSGSYVNRHHKWADNFADSFANAIPLFLPVRRIA